MLLADISGNLLLVMHSCLLDFGLKDDNITMQYHKYSFTLSAMKFDDSNILIKSALIKPSATGKKWLLVAAIMYHPS